MLLACCFPPKPIYQTSEQSSGKSILKKIFKEVISFVLSALSTVLFFDLELLLKFSINTSMNLFDILSLLLIFYSLSSSILGWCSCWVYISHYNYYTLADQ